MQGSLGTDEQSCVIIWREPKGRARIGLICPESKTRCSNCKATPLMPFWPLVRLGSLLKRVTSWPLRMLITIIIYLDYITSDGSFCNTLGLPDLMKKRKLHRLSLKVGSVHVCFRQGRSTSAIGLDTMNVVL